MSSPPPPYAETVRNAIVAAYYPRLTAAPDSVRTRAQAAYAVSSTLAAALVGAGLLTSLSGTSWLLKSLGLAALVTWLLTAGLYASAVGSRVPDVPQSSATDANLFVHEVLAAARKEKGIIEKRLKRANLAAVAAAILTASTFFAALTTQGRNARFEATIVLNPTATRMLSAQCGLQISTLTGAVSLKSPDTAFVDVEPVHTSCPKLGHLLISRAAIVSIEDYQKLP